MQTQSTARKFHDTCPIDCPLAGWTRCELCHQGQVTPVVNALTNAMGALGYPRKDSYAAEVVIREAISNALRHGHQNDGTRTVLVNYHVGPDKVLMEVADEGFGFNPYCVPNPLDTNHEAGQPRQWGLLLMQVYSTWIRFNQRGNRVVLCKRRSPC